jgi:hypothetical protein
MAIAANKPMTVTTIIISTNVNPFKTFFLVFINSISYPRFTGISGMVVYPAYAGHEATMHEH